MENERTVAKHPKKTKQTASESETMGQTTSDPPSTCAAEQIATSQVSQEIDHAKVLEQIDNIIHVQQQETLNGELHDLRERANIQQSITDISRKVNREIQTKQMGELQSNMMYVASKKLEAEIEVLNEEHNKKATKLLNDQREELRSVAIKDKILSEGESNQEMKGLKNQFDQVLSKNDELRSQLKEALEEKASCDKLPSFLKLLANKIEKGTLGGVLLDLLQCISKGEGHHWSPSVKSLYGMILNYGGPASHDVLRHNLGGPSLISTYQLMRPDASEKVATTLVDIDLNKAAEYYKKMCYSGPFIVSVDATAVVRNVRVRNGKMYGLLCGPVDLVGQSYSDIENIIDSNEQANQLYSYILVPLCDSLKSYTLAVISVEKNESFETVQGWQELLGKKACDSSLPILGFGADGDSKIRKYWNNMIQKYPGDDMAGILEKITMRSGDFLFSFPDPNHAFKKLRNQVLNVRKLLLLGGHTIQLEHVMDMYHSSKMLRRKSGLWKTDVHVHDRQNVNAALRFFSKGAREAVRDWDKDKSAGTQAYMLHGFYLIQSLHNKDLELGDRINYAWRTRTFLQVWRGHLLLNGQSLEDFFISSQCYEDCMLLTDSLIFTMVYLSKHYPYLTFQPWTFGSDECEKFFAKIRTFVKGKSNLCLAEVIDIANRLAKQNILLAEAEIKDRFGQDTSARKYKLPAKPQYPCPSDMIQIIKEQTCQAEHVTIEILKEFGMVQKLEDQGYITSSKGRQKIAPKLYLLDSSVRKKPPADNHGNNDSDNNDGGDDNDDDHRDVHGVIRIGENSEQEEVSGNITSADGEEMYANDVKMMKKGYIFVDGTWLHPASAVSSIVGKKYTPTTSRQCRFRTSDFSDSYTKIKESQMEGQIIRHGSFLAAMNGSKLIFGEVVRISTKKKKNHYPVSGMVYDLKKAVGIYQMYIKLMDLLDNVLHHSRPHEFVQISDINIVKVVSKEIDADELQVIQQRVKIQEKKVKAENEKREKERRNLPEKQLTKEELKKYLKDLGEKRYSSLNKHDLVERLKRAKQKAGSSTGTKNCNSAFYDGSLPLVKHVFFDGSFTYEDLDTYLSCASAQDVSV